MKRVGILSVVDRPRPGLMDHSHAFASLAGPHGYDVTCMHLGEGDVQWGSWRLLRACREVRLLVIWSFGLTIALLPLIRLLAPHLKVAFVYHEPGGLRQKMRKGDPLFPSLVSAVLERLAIIFSHQILIPREDKAQEFQDVRVIFAPLLYDASASNVDNALARNNVLYLGRKDHRRKLDLFLDQRFRDSIGLGSEGVEFKFFPGEGGDVSFLSKLKAIKESSVVMNIYTVPYNQSGVTVEALVHGVPVVVSSHDPHAKRLSRFGLVVNPHATDQEIAETLRSAIVRRSELSPKLADLGSELGGGVCFDKYWDRWIRPMLI